MGFNADAHDPSVSVKRCHLPSFAGEERPSRRYFAYVYLKSQWLAPCMMVCVRSSLSLGS